jgi:hypothetical protein
MVELKSDGHWLEDPIIDREEASKIIDNESSKNTNMVDLDNWITFNYRR